MTAAVVVSVMAASSDASMVIVVVALFLDCLFVVVAIDAVMFVTKIALLRLFPLSPFCMLFLLLLLQLSVPLLMRLLTILLRPVLTPLRWCLADVIRSHLCSSVESAIGPGSTVRDLADRAGPGVKSLPGVRCIQNRTITAAREILRA